MKFCIWAWLGILPLTGGYPDAPQQGEAALSKELRIEVREAIRMREYFSYMDSLVTRHRMQVPYPLTEHLIVHANPWILERLTNTDYYRLMARDSFVYDQRELIVLPAGSQVLLPDSLEGERIRQRLKTFRLDVNIPEFKLRIFQDSLELFAIPVRVGQNRKRYLELSKRETDLRTLTGKGKVIRHDLNPAFYNPVDGKRFYTTLRDDGKRTLMPMIPWIETEINGRRNGQLIHPTTNPSTLGKASSNGCIGTGEADAWIVYYHAPLGTPIHIRYDLEVPAPGGGILHLQDIYGWGKEKNGEH